MKAYMIMVGIAAFIEKYIVRPIKALIGVFK